MEDVTGTSVAFDRAASFYDATRGFPPGVGEVLAVRVAGVAGLTRASRVLEIGVGTGRIALPLSRFVGRYVGVDLSRPMLAVLHEKQHDEPIAVMRGDVTRLPLADRQFDLAVVCHVFHLVGEWRRAIAELGRVVRPGGAVLLLGNDMSTDAGIVTEWKRLRDAHHAPHGGSLPGTSDGALIGTALEEEGFAERTEGVAAEWIRTFTPNESLASLANRLWGSTWSIPEPTLAAIIADLRAWITATFPDPDATLQETMRCRYALLRRPAVTLDIQTERLRLRPVGAGDVGWFQRCWNEPEVGRFLWDERAVARGMVEEAVAASEGTFREHGYGLWAIVEGGALVGFCGLRPEAGSGEVELLYALEVGAWGRGLGSEAARAVLRYAFDALGLARVVATANPANVASWRVLEQVGMRQIGLTEVGGEPLFKYVVERGDVVPAAGDEPDGRGRETADGPA